MTLNEIQRRQDSIVLYQQTRQESKDRMILITQSEIIPSIILGIAIVVASWLRRQA